MAGRTQKSSDRVGVWWPRPSTAEKTNRRTFLSKIGGATGLAGMAGCTSLLGRDPLTIGYESSFRTLQAPVMVQKGYLDELDASVEVKRYGGTNGSIGEKYADGTVEVGLEDVTSVILRHAMDEVDHRVLAATNRNDCAFLAREAFAESWTEHGPDAFARFEEENGEPFEMAMTESHRPVLWLDAIGLSRERVELNRVDHVPSIRTQIRKGTLDGVFHPEPTLTKLAGDDAGLEEVAWVGSAFSSLPGGVVVVPDEFREDEPELVRSILEKHVEATKVLNERPDEAAPIVGDAFGDDLSTSLAKTMLEKKTANFVSDPRRIIEGTNALGRIMADIDSAEQVSADEIIDPGPYTDVA